MLPSYLWPGGDGRAGLLMQECGRAGGRNRRRQQFSAAQVGEKGTERRQRRERPPEKRLSVFSSLSLGQNLWGLRMSVMHTRVERNARSPAERESKALLFFLFLPRSHGPSCSWHVLAFALVPFLELQFPVDEIGTHVKRGGERADETHEEMFGGNKLGFS